MPQASRFGTLNGVFTPSILTILGVIMYLRLPWNVGQAGLFAAAGIIIVAHILSFSTGLSVASIATDKKVKAGGIYYIISRSLGLPIGGTLGLALFVGLSLSISLYIIGFVESLLPFFGIEVTKEAIRIYGTIAVIGVAGVVMKRTSPPLKPVITTPLDRCVIGHQVHLAERAGCISSLPECPAHGPGWNILHRLKMSIGIDAGLKGVLAAQDGMTTR